MNAMNCLDCDAELENSVDVMVGEILSCGDCGLEHEITKVAGNQIEIQELLIEGEDWGE